VTLHAKQAHTSMAATSETPDVPIDCVLFDLDGVVYHGSRAVDGTAEGINWLHSQHIPVNYVTNNATRTPEATAEKITGVGINATVDEVTTSAQVLAERLAERFGPGARIHLLGTTGLHIALEDAGLEITDTLDAKPVAIAQGLDPNIDYQAIVRACEIIRSGAEWWASNPDFSLLTESGKVPGNGAFIDLISRLTDTEPVIVGKPAPHMMEFAAGRLGARRPLMVGDRLNTDIEGGNAAGIDTALVLTGIHDIHDALRAAPERRPTFILPNLRGLEALITGSDRGESSQVEAELRRAWAAIDAGDTDAEAVLAERRLPRTIEVAVEGEGS
jgi:glycerol 3-phosphatase-2